MNKLIHDQRSRKTDFLHVAIMNYLKDAKCLRNQHLRIEPQNLQELQNQRPRMSRFLLKLQY